MDKAKVNTVAQTNAERAECALFEEYGEKFQLLFAFSMRPPTNDE